MPTGLTKDAGWQLGVRRTAPVPLDVAWAFLLGDGLPRWLGVDALGDVGSRYVAADGTAGEVRSRTDRRRIRLTWRPAGADHDTTLQVTVLEAAGGTTIAFHQERLASEAERERLLPHWRETVEALVGELADRRPR